MDKEQFKTFCKKEFELRGFKKIKNVFYFLGKDVLCGIDLQKSYYGDVYYINYYFFIGDYSNELFYPTYADSDIQGRMHVMSKKQTNHGKHFITDQIEYIEYAEDDLRSFFENEFTKIILPPVYQGKKYILNNLNKLYFLTLN